MVRREWAINRRLTFAAMMPAVFIKMLKKINDANSGMRKNYDSSHTCEIGLACPPRVFCDQSRLNWPLTKISMIGGLKGRRLLGRHSHKAARRYRVIACDFGSALIRVAWNRA
jgi:hypothetical protein